ncbi:hypothetical protein SPRG_16289, partial [Saprolegnia parasitica CBS 223.65]
KRVFYTKKCSHLQAHLSEGPRSDPEVGTYESWFACCSRPRPSGSLTASRTARSTGKGVYIDTALPRKDSQPVRDQHRHRHTTRRLIVADAAYCVDRHRNRESRADARREGEPPRPLRHPRRRLGSHLSRRRCHGGYKGRSAFRLRPMGPQYEQRQDGHRYSGRSSSTREHKPPHWCGTRSTKKLRSLLDVAADLRAWRRLAT